jgi:hypothetical protein
VWRTVLSGDVDWLTERISSFEMSHENGDEALALKDRSPRDRAFREKRSPPTHNRPTTEGRERPNLYMAKTSNGEAERIYSIHSVGLGMKV